MKEILFFSNNENKIVEISNLFLKSNYKVFNLNDFNKIDSPDEIGSTFKQNAKIKSLYGLKKFNKICFADDSGICIDAMDGKPNVSSKKFLGSESNKFSVFNKIISRAENRKNFKAFFETSICLSLNIKDHIFFSGKVNGKISKTIRGFNGFGYDSIFIPNGYKVTFAQMDQKEKNLISHRGLAIKKLKKYLNLI